MDYLYDEIEDTTIYKVVVNQMEQYSIWFAERENPPGWSDAGFRGSKEECISHIEQLWTDRKPTHFRN